MTPCYPQLRGFAGYFGFCGYTQPAAEIYRASDGDLLGSLAGATEWPAGFDGAPDLAKE